MSWAVSKMAWVSSLPPRGIAGRINHPLMAGAHLPDTPTAFHRSEGRPSEHPDLTTMLCCGNDPPHGTGCSPSAATSTHGPCAK